MRVKVRLTLVALAIAFSSSASIAAAPKKTTQDAGLGYRQLDPVALREPDNNASPEQWEDRPIEGKGVRNVVNPVLTPVLPMVDRSNGLAVIVAPGGGFVNLAYDNEGVRVAQHLAQNGIAAFILKYRLRPTPRGEKEYQKFMSSFMRDLGDDKDDKGNSQSNGKIEIATPPEAVEDALAAVRVIRERAEDWNVDPDKVGLIGFSAGAMTALGAGLASEPAARPDFIAPIYGPRTPGPIPADAPPMFLAIALDDPLFDIENTIALIKGWNKAARPYEVHLYEKGGHGFGMRPRSESTALWTGQFLAWMKDRGLFLAASERRAHEFQTMKLNQMLGNPAMRAVLDRHLPMLVTGPGPGMVGNLSLKEIAGFAPQMLSPEKLEPILAELIALP